GLASRVRLHGWADQPTVQAMLRDCHAVVCASVTDAQGNREGIPNIIKEAMAFARPVVATRHGGIPEAVVDGQTGLLAAEGDPAALRDAILRIIDHPERWAAMGRAGQRRAE